MLPYAIPSYTSVKESGMSSSFPPLSLLIVAAFPAVRAGLRALLHGTQGLEVVGELTPTELATAVTLPPVDVAVVDIGDDASDLLSLVDNLLAEAPVVLVAVDAGEYEGVELNGPAARALVLRQAGADELAAAVQAVSRGLMVFDPRVARAITSPRALRLQAHPEDGSAPEPLTEREQQVLSLLALGLPNKAIALRLGISDHTVKFHVGSILAKLDAAGRTEAVMVAARRGLLPL